MALLEELLGEPLGEPFGEPPAGMVRVETSAYVARLRRLVDAPSYSAYAADVPGADYLYEGPNSRLAELADDMRTPAAWTYDEAVVVEDADTFVRALYWFEAAPAVSSWRSEMARWGFEIALRNEFWRFKHPLFARGLEHAAGCLLRPPPGLTNPYDCPSEYL